MNFKRLTGRDVFCRNPSKCTGDNRRGDWPATGPLPQKACQLKSSEIVGSAPGDWSGGKQLKRRGVGWGRRGGGVCIRSRDTRDQMGKGGRQLEGWRKM